MFPINKARELTPAKHIAFVSLAICSLATSIVSLTTLTPCANAAVVSSGQPIAQEANKLKASEAYSEVTSKALSQQRWQHPLLHKNYHVVVNNLTGTVTLKDNNAKDIVSVAADHEQLPQAQMALEEAKKKLELNLVNGDAIGDAKPMVDQNQIQLKAGNNVFTMLSTLAPNAGAISLEDRHNGAYLMTNKLREAYGLDPLIVPTVPLRRKASEFDSSGLASIAAQALPHPLADGYELLKGTGKLFSGMASWYGPGFHGRKCANGERFNMHGLTAASRSLPFGTMIKVTNKKNGKAVIVRINDRGPFAHGRILDVSKGAAEKIGLTSSGVAPVVIEVLTKGAKKILTQ
jgi:rare lipoprotein A